jgi:DNA replication factor GINS
VSPSRHNCSFRTCHISCAYYLAEHDPVVAELLVLDVGVVQLVHCAQAVAVQQITKLNQTERMIAAVIMDRPLCDLQQIREVVGLGQTHVYEIIHGKKNSGNKGLLEKIPELTCYYKNEIDPETSERWGRNRYELPKDWSIVDTKERIVYWKEDDNDSDQDQLRGISDYIAEEERNSEHDVEGLFSRLEGINGDTIHSTNTNFATSEEHETRKATPLGYPVAPQRNCETEPSASLNEPIEQVKPETEAKNALRSISETRSEVERNDSEVGPAVTYTEVRVLRDVPDFIGLDEQTYALTENDVIFLPETQARLLVKKKLAMFTDEAHMRTGI